jgi:hypothetical protein
MDQLRPRQRINNLYSPEFDQLKQKSTDLPVFRSRPR